MKFDKSRVYTAINADELPIGSKVIVADNLASLKKKVAAFYDENAIAYITEVCDIISENCESRFKIVERNYDRCLYSYYRLAYLVAEPEPKPNHIKCEELKIGDIISDGDLDYMVLGVHRSNGIVSDVFLPCIGWRDNANLKNFHKKEEQSKSFEIEQAYNKGTNDMFEFCQEWFKENKSLPGLVEVALHLFWHKFHEKFD